MEFSSIFSLASLKDGLVMDHISCGNESIPGRWNLHLRCHLNDHESETISMFLDCLDKAIILGDSVEDKWLWRHDPKGSL